MISLITMNRNVSMKQALKMMQATGEANWSTEELKAIDKKMLRKMANSNGDATSGIPAELKEQMRIKGFSDVDRKHVLEMLEMSEEKSSAHSRPDAFLSTNGGRMHFTPTTVTYKSLSGESKQRANSPIPAEFGEAEQRGNVVQVAALCSQFVSVQAGAWKSCVNLTPYASHYKGTEFNAAALPGLTTKICVILNDDNVWQTLPLVTRSGITGIAAMVFVRQALNRCSATSYDVLNTSIVCDLFRIFQKVGNSWIRVMKDKTVPLLPDTMYEVVDCDDDAFDLLSQSYPGCYHYLGGQLIVPFMPESDGTLSAALRCAQRMRELQGPSDCTTAVLAGMRGFSGLTDDFGKRIQFSLSVILSLWSLGRKVDLQLLTVGDIAIFQSSIIYWRALINNVEKPLVGWDPALACDLCYLLPGVEDMQKIPQAYRAFVRDNPRDDAVSVHWTKTQLPTAEEKKKVVDYDKSSELVVPRYAHTRDFVAMTTVFGAIPFPHDPVVVRRVEQSLCKLDWYVSQSKLRTRLFVYKFTNASGFRGILSTIPDLNLVGHGFPFVDRGKGIRDKTIETLHFIPLEHIKTEASWYNVVSDDCSLQVSSFLAPRSRYSPISNLPRMSKNAMIVNRASMDAELGVLIGNFTAVKNRTVVGDNVSDWGRRRPILGVKPEALSEKTRDLVKFKADTNLSAPTPSSSVLVKLSDNVAYTDTELPDQVEEEEDEINLNPFNQADDYDVKSDLTEDEAAIVIRDFEKADRGARKKITDE